MAHLSLTFLGGFEVVLESEPVTTFGADKVRALLAYLAIGSSRAYRRAELSGMFWPDLSEKKAAHNLSQSLLRLRRALQEPKESTAAAFLLISSQEVQFNFNSDSRLDVSQFREFIHLSQHHRHAEPANCETCVQWLHQAVDLYRGNVLSGLLVPDSMAFEEWRLVLQEELHGQALEALQRLAAYYERRGDFKKVQEYARRQVMLEPWSEEAHLQLMRALVQTGEASAALRQYEVYQRTLAEELGIKPSADITSLYEQINAGQTADEQPASRDNVWMSQHGERRQVTALVCSRGIEEDPEELQAQLSVCERHCEGIFNRFGGRRGVRHGDACVVYFGYPQAFEDAARRAVHSGLAIAEALKEVGEVRIGIHTGPMTVGEKRGRRWQNRDLIGKVPEIARDCLSLAGPGEIIITKETQNLVRESFSLQPIGSRDRDVEGRSSASYHVLGEDSSQRRLDWLAQTQRLTPLTGRDTEFAQLKTAYEKMLHGEGQVVFLRGEPGIGKSRLLWELEKSAPMVDAQNNMPPVPWVTGRCLPHDQNTSLHPMIGLLEGLLGFQAEDSPDIRREKLKGMLAWYQLDRPSAIWLLSILLGLPTDGTPPQTITRAQREQMRQIFIALVQKRAVEQPLVLVVEDLHWSDPSTVEWIRQSINSLASVTCLTLLTSRPGFDPAWLQESQSSALILSPQHYSPSSPNR